ncbi:MAG: hypothetical protein AAF550_03830, partial [Myxococcota bacterium]
MGDVKTFLATVVLSACASAAFTLVLVHPRQYPIARATHALEYRQRSTPLPEEPRVSPPLRVLFVGNSYTKGNRLPEMVRRLAS